MKPLSFSSSASALSPTQRRCVGIHYILARTLTSFPPSPAPLLPPHRMTARTSPSPAPLLPPHRMTARMLIRIILYCFPTHLHDCSPETPIPDPLGTPHCHDARGHARGLPPLLSEPFLSNCGVSRLEMARNVVGRDLISSEKS